MVRTLAAMGGTQDEIARRLGIKSEKTLRKYFRADIDQGVSEANLTVARRSLRRPREGTL
jgi:hypothetical protein